MLSIRREKLNFLIVFVVAVFTAICPSPINSMPSIISNNDHFACPIRIQTKECPRGEEVGSDVARKCELIRMVVNELKEKMMRMENAGNAEFSVEHLSTLLKPYLDPMAKAIEQEQPEVAAKAREMVNKLVEQQQGGGGGEGEMQMIGGSDGVGGEGWNNNRAKRLAVTSVDVAKVLLGSLKRDLNDPFVLSTLAYLSAEILFLPAVFPIQLGGMALCAFTMYERTFVENYAKEREKLRKKQEQINRFQ